MFVFTIADRLVTNAVQYIDQCPQAFESPLPRSEDQCIQKIVDTLNARQDGQDGQQQLLAGEVFQEYYNNATETVSLGEIPSRGVDT